LPAVPAATGLSLAAWTIPATLSGAKDYRWKVVARTSNGSSTSSPTWSFMTAGVISDYETRIPDAALRSALASATMKSWGDISTDDLDAIEELYVSESSIVDITGIELCHSLRILNASYNSITEISALRRLFMLERLFLQSNKISDISPLAGLSRLQFLRLHTNPIPFEGVSEVVTRDNYPDLIALSLRGLMSGTTYITSSQLVSVLSDFEGLQNLVLRSFPDITESQLSDITTRFAGTLDWLTIGSSRLTDAMFVSCIAGLPALSGLDVGWNNLTEAAFAGTPSYAPEWEASLNFLCIDGNTGISNIGFLKDMYDAGSFQAEGAEVYMEYMELNHDEGTANDAVLDYLVGEGLAIYYENQTE